MQKLTRPSIANMSPPAKGQSFLWDSDVRGFGVRAMSSGVKTFVVQYRNGEGRTRRLAIGRCSVLTLDQARTLAKIKLGEVAAGRDPADERAQERSAITIAELCDWYLEEATAGRLLGRRNRPIKASSLYMDRSRIERHIKPLIGSRKVKALKTHDIEAFQADIAAGKTARGRVKARGRETSGGHGAASRTISTLHAIFGHGKRLGKIDTNPATGVRRMASQPRMRRLSAEELVALGQAMREAAQRESKSGLAALRFLVLTGFRLNEVQKLERAWLDFDTGCVRFPDTKSGAQVRVIGGAAASVVRELHDGDSPFVFVSDLGDGHYKQLPDLIQRVTLAAKLPSVTAHTLRHTLGSVAGDMGFSELTIAGLLGHGKRGVTQGYIHIEDGLRVAAERVAARIGELLDGTRSTIRDTATAVAA